MLIGALVPFLFHGMNGIHNIVPNLPQIPSSIILKPVCRYEAMDGYDIYSDYGYLLCAWFRISASRLMYLSQCGFFPSVSLEVRT